MAEAAVVAQPTSAMAPMNGLETTDIGNQALRAKQARVKAEQDRQLLQNRINRLVVEEEKAA